MTSFVSQMQVLLVKDIRALVRKREIVVGCFGFALLLVVVSSFSFRVVGYGQEELRSVTPGILWVIFLFSGVVTLGQSFSVEHENGALKGLLMSGCDPGLIYVSKFITNLVFLVFLQISVLVFHGILFGVEYFALVWPLSVIVVLSSVGFVAIGTILSFIASAVRGRELVLPLMLFPLCVPLVAAAVSLTRSVLTSGGMSGMDFWLTLIIVFDIVSSVTSFLLFEYLLVE